MNCTLLPVLLLTAGFWMPMSAVANDYYVDSVAGNDANNGTTPTKPWKTIGKVNALDLNPGDTVNLKCGSSFTVADYQTVLLLGPEDCGTEAQPITIRSYGDGEKPLLYQTYSSSRNSAVVGLFGEVNNIVIDGLHLKGLLGTHSPVSGRDGIDVFSTALLMDSSLHSNVTIRNCEIEGGTRGLLLYRCKNFTIANNWIHDVNGANTNTRDWDPVWPEQHSGAPLDPVLYPNGADDDSGAEAIDLNSYTENIAIYGNWVESIWYDSYDYGKDGTFIELYEGNHRNIQIHHNVVLDCPGGTVEMGAWSGGVVEYFTFAYNLIVDGSTLYMIHCGAGQYSLSDINNICFDNNTFIQREIDNDDERPWTIFDVNGTLKDASKLKVRNNIFDLKTGTRNLWRGNPASNMSSIYGNDDAFTHTNNLYYQEPGAQGRFLFAMRPDRSEIIGCDPEFTDPDGFDFSLMETSPAVDAGINLGYGTDLAGHAVTGTPDLGAYER